MPRSLSRKSLLLCFFALLSSTPGMSGRQVDPSGPTLTLAEFEQELERRLDQVERLETDASQVGILLREIPPHWKVTDGARVFVVKTDLLQSTLAAFRPGQKGSPIAIEQMRTWLRSLRSEAAELGAPEKAGRAPEDKLQEILKRREFRGVGEPSYLELLTKRLQLRFFRFLEWLFGNVGRSGIGDLLVWLLIGLLVILLGILLVRTLRNANRRVVGKLEPLGESIPVRSWRQWLAECEKCAARGDFRAAVHAGYWAGLAWLEETGSLKADRARTPRESLRLLGLSDPRRAPLRRMTESLETTWYGYRDATRTDVTDLRARLEELGCPVNAPPVTAAS